MDLPRLVGQPVVVSGTRERGVTRWLEQKASPPGSPRRDGAEGPADDPDPG